MNIWPFTRSVHVNKYNCQYRSDINLHWMKEIHTQYSVKINVWTSIIGNRKYIAIGSIFFDANLTGEKYQQFLQYQLVSALSAIALDLSQLGPDLPT